MGKKLMKWRRVHVNSFLIKDVRASICKVEKRPVKSGKCKETSSFSQVQKICETFYEKVQC